MTDAQAPATEESAPAAIFNIEKLYVKDLSLEIPHAPGIFLERENPQIDLQLHTAATPIEEGVYEVTVTVTVTAKLPLNEAVNSRYHKSLEPIKDVVMFLIEA